MRKLFFVEGALSIVQSDNGKEFKIRKILDMYQEFNVIRRFSRPRHPQSQGIVERANQTLMRRLSKAVFGKGACWINKLGNLFSINF